MCRFRRRRRNRRRASRRKKPHQGPRRHPPSRWRRRRPPPRRSCRFRQSAEYGGSPAADESRRPAAKDRGKSTPTLPVRCRASPGRPGPSSSAEIAALLARGDALLGTGDITSARLFSERAADTDSGLAALRLGATYGMVFPEPAGLRAPTADPVQALFWYWHVRELAVSAAEPRIKALEARPLGATDTRSR